MVSISERSSTSNRNVKNFRVGSPAIRRMGRWEIIIYYNNTVWADIIAESEEEVERRARRMVRLLNDEEWKDSEQRKKVIGHDDSRKRSKRN